MTNGIVSVVSGDVTLVKCVAGCDGYNAKKLADILRRERVTSRKRAYEVALSVGFGCADCLVVLDADGAECSHSTMKVVAHGWRGSLQQRRWNPRWYVGTAAHVHVVRLSRAEEVERLKESENGR